MCSCFGGRGKERNKEAFFLIKGPFCFVFSNEQASAPKYAVCLQSMRPCLHKCAGRSGHADVLLETSLGDVEYECSFSSEETATAFKNAVEKQATKARTEATEKRLGHTHLLKEMRSSYHFAEQVAKKKELEQPSGPLTTEEVIATMPADIYLLAET